MSNITVYEGQKIIKSKNGCQEKLIITKVYNKQSDCIEYSNCNYPCEGLVKLNNISAGFEGEGCISYMKNRIEYDFLKTRNKIKKVRDN